MQVAASVSSLRHLWVLLPPLHGGALSVSLYTGCKGLCAAVLAKEE